MRTATFIVAHIILISLLTQDVYALECPPPITQISKDWEVEVNATVAKIGPAKGPELKTKTKNATQNLLDKLPASDRIYLEHMMYSTYCSSLRDDKQISDSEKSRRLHEYNSEIRKTITAYSPGRSRDQNKDVNNHDKSINLINNKIELPVQNKNKATRNSEYDDFIITGATNDEKDAIKSALHHLSIASATIDITKSARDSSRNVNIRVTYQDNTVFSDFFNTPLDNASNLIISTIDNGRTKK
jgi:hypothetical protein